MGARKDYHRAGVYVHAKKGSCPLVSMRMAGGYGNPVKCIHCGRPMRRKGG